MLVQAEVQCLTQLYLDLCLWEGDSRSTSPKRLGGGKGKGAKRERKKQWQQSEKESLLIIIAEIQATGIDANKSNKWASEKKKRGSYSDPPGIKERVSPVTSSQFRLSHQQEHRNRTANFSGSCSTSLLRLPVHYTMWGYGIPIRKIIKPEQQKRIHLTKPRRFAWVLNIYKKKSYLII